MIGIVIVSAVIAALIWNHRQGKLNKRLFFAELRRLNHDYGTRFPTDEGGMDLILSNGSFSETIVFDPSTKRLCLIAGTRRHAELLDFSYIRRWQLKWTEKSQNGGLSYQNVHFDFSTNDIRRPLLRISARDKTHGDIWNSRLAVLLT